MSVHVCTYRKLAESYGIPCFTSLVIINMSESIVSSCDDVKIVGGSLRIDWATRGEGGERERAGGLYKKSQHRHTLVERFE
jgi:hypothetical protein